MFTKMKNFLDMPYPNLKGSAEVWDMYKLFQNHPLRTMDLDEAMFFIPPVFVNTINPVLREKNADRRNFISILDEVTGSDIYQR